MVTDKQVRRLMEILGKGKSLAVLAAKSDMDEKTARKYRDLGELPSEIRTDHTWRTREDPFVEVWERRYPGSFADGQIRTLQRRVKTWRALEGSAKEVFFPQVHEPGDLCQSDFTDMKALGVTILGEPFDHLFLLGSGHANILNSK